MNYIYTRDWTVTNTEELTEDFIRFPEEIRWDFCNASVEYIHKGIESGNLIEIKSNGTIMSEHIYSPSEYGVLIGIKDYISDSISISKFDELIADKYNKWNYPLSEINYLKDNDAHVVIVCFPDGYRFVEI